MKDLMSKYQTIDVLGCGANIKQYHNSPENFKIGVNDVWKHFKTDVLLVVDHPESFSDERRHIIENSRPRYFMSQLCSWADMPNFSRMWLASNGGDVSTLEDISALPIHVDSTFTATALAYHFSMKNVVLWGVDFYGSPLMEWREQILFAYSCLANKMKVLGINLYVGYKNSLLSEVLPVFECELIEA